MTVRNRMVMSPMETMYGTPDGLPSERTRKLAADSVVIAGTVEPDTDLFDTLVATMPDAEVHAAGDCSGLGLIRKATRTVPAPRVPSRDRRDSNDPNSPIPGADRVAVVLAMRASPRPGRLAGADG
jgi:hypothetical protein